MKKAIAMLTTALLVLTCAACGGESHIYDSAQVVDMMNGFGTKVVGKTSVIKADSKEVTEEALNDWYFNYVEKNDFNVCVIVYTDQKGKGVYAANGHVERDTGLEEDTNSPGSYSWVYNKDAIVYVPSGGKLKEIRFE